MKMTPYDGWAFARLLSGHRLLDQVAPVSKHFAALAAELDGLPPEHREQTWRVALGLMESSTEAAVLAVAAADPEGPPPEVEAPRRPANLGDVRRFMSREQWLWPLWIPSSRVGGLSAPEGIGKTRTAMDLSRRIWFGEPWPDGQAATLPAGTPTLWICSDGQQDDLVMAAEALGMPDEAIHFNTLPEDPYGGTAIDDPESLELLESFISQTKYGLVFIDSLTFATSKDLCVANHVKDLMTPVRDLSQRHQTTIVPLLHVSKDGQALGKRIKGIARTIIHLECPDPEEPTRLKMSVVKSFAKRPPALGVTLTDAGNLYDANPPGPPPAGPVGRPPSARTEAVAFILDALTTRGEQKATELCQRWEETGKGKTAFWDARDALVAGGRISCVGRPLVLAIKPPDPEVDPSIF